MCEKVIWESSNPEKEEVDRFLWWKLAAGGYATEPSLLCYISLPQKTFNRSTFQLPVTGLYAR